MSMSDTSGVLVLRDFPLALMPSSDVRAIEQMSSAELRRALAESMAATAASLVRLALIVRVLEERGEDVSELRLPLLTYLRLIAHGQLLPELVARFAENPPLIRQLTFLPLASQRAIAGGEPVKLVVRNGDGYSHRLADPSKLDMGQRNQVFARDHVRSEEEQILYLEARKSTVPARAKRAGRVRVDHDRGGILLGRSFFARGDLLEALAALASPPADEDAERASVCAVKLSEAEHARLRVAAAQAGLTMQELCVKALRATGII